MKKLSGKKLAEGILLDLKKRVDLSDPPQLDVILVGDDSASELYVRNKRLRASDIGIKTVLHHLGQASSEDDVIALVEKLNTNSNTDGILVQLPLPRGLSADRVIASIDPRKDADGFHPQNRESKNPIVEPVLGQAVHAFVSESGIETQDKNAVVILRKASPLRQEIKEALEKHQMSVKIFQEISQAEAALKKASVVVIGRAGREFQHALKGDALMSGALVIDIGTIRDPNHPRKVFGNVDPESTKNLPGFRTPVPGGVGPLTIAFLLKNVVELQQS